MNDASGEMEVYRRVIWFAVAMLAAMVLAGLLVFPAPPVVGVAPLFPAGLLFFWRGWPAPILGWAIYIGLLGLLLKARTSGQIALVFLVVCIVLAVNVGGCKYMADNTRLPHSI